MAKHSVSNTLAHKAKIIYTKQQALHKEVEHIRKALQACSFPQWALNSLHNKFNHKHNIQNGQNSADNQPNNNKNNTGTNNKRRKSPYWYLTSMAWGTGSKGHATTWGSRYISRVVTT